MTKHQQTNTCKFIHGWQNVGAQKYLINKNTTEHLCPFGCDSVEIQHHYLYCKEPAIMGERELHLSQLFNKLKHLDTAPFLLLLWQHYLTDHLNYSGPNPNREDQPHPFPPSLINIQCLETFSKAIISQTSIGWDQFFNPSKTPKFCLDFDRFSEAHEHQYGS